MTYIVSNIGMLINLFNYFHTIWLFGKDGQLWPDLVHLVAYLKDDANHWGFIGLTFTHEIPPA